MDGGILKPELLCCQCSFNESAAHHVYGEGDSSARVLLVGEAPGYEEDRTGRPFVGEAGRLLRRIIYQLGLKASDFFITNVFKCRPPGNVVPVGKELDKHIEICSNWMALDLARFFGLQAVGAVEDEYWGLTTLRKRIRPQSEKSVVLLGATALRAFTGYAAITKFEGRKVSSFAYKDEAWADKTWVAYHPAFALPGRRPAVAVNIYRVLYKAARQAGLKVRRKPLEKMREYHGIT